MSSIGKYTCPLIDKNIDEFKGILEDYIFKVVEDMSPMYLDTESGKSYIKNICSDLYQDTESIFENVRQSNSDLRSAAESIIQELEETIDNLEVELKDLR